MSGAALASMMFRFVFLMMLGFVLAKVGFLTDSMRKNLSALLVKLLLPFNILVSGNAVRTGGAAQNMAWMAVFSAVYLGAGLLLATGAERLLHIKGDRRGVFALMATFPNSAFLGFPVIQEVFGEEGVLYTMIFNIFFNLLMFTVGVHILNKEEKLSIGKILLEPATIASALSICLFLSPLRLPENLLYPLREVGAASVPISLLIVGANLAGVRLLDLFRDRDCYLVSLLKMAVFPLLALGAFWALGVHTMSAATLVILASLPVATLTVILAEQNGRDVDFATRTVVQGVLFMLVQLPVVLYLVGRLLPT